MRRLGIILTHIIFWMSYFLLLSCAGSRHLGPVLSSFPIEKHPVLLFTAEEIPTIRSRIEREPCTSWWKWVKGKADEALSVNFSETTLERKKSEYAKVLAFAYIVTENITYAEKAREVLESITSRCAGGKWGDIHTEMDAVPNYCLAYDMIAPYLKGSPDSDRRIRTEIFEEGHRLYTYSSLKETANNWRIRRCAALGFCALVIADYGEDEDGIGPKDWHAKAIKGVMKTIDHQTASDGGYAEGPNYLQYSASLYVPYLLALYRATGQNLFKTNPLAVLHDWGIKIRLPNGQRPNFDDAALDDFYGGLFARLSPSPSIHQWDWLQAEGESFAPGYKMVDAICNFDDAIETKPPDWNPTLFLPEAGNGIFRSDWSSEAIYMLLLGEHGKARLHGGGHDHPDPTSFIVNAYGQILAIDSGYIKWKERHKINKAENHNLILVDGKGPSPPRWFFKWFGGTDAHLQNYYATEFLDYCEVKTRYQGVDFLRSVLFPDHRYFVVIDEIRSNREHRYSWLLHGNGLSSERTFSLADRGGFWSQSDVSLHAYVAAPLNAAVSERQDVHSFHYGEEKTHSLITANVEAKNATYISLLYPNKVGDTMPDISPLAFNGINGAKIERNGRVELIFVNDGEEIVSIPDSATGCGPIRTAARISFAGFHHGTLSYVTNIEGTLYEHNQRTVFASEEKITIALRCGDGGLDGYVKGEGQYHFELFSDSRPSLVLFRDNPVDFQYEDGKIALCLENEGNMSVRYE